jgi:hypothetical protein
MQRSGAIKADLIDNQGPKAGHLQSFGIDDADDDVAPNRDGKSAPRGFRTCGLLAGIDLQVQ